MPVLDRKKGRCHYLDAAISTPAEILRSLATILQFNIPYNINKDLPSYLSMMITEAVKQIKSHYTLPVVCLDHVDRLPANIISTIARIVQCGAMALLTLSHQKWQMISKDDDALQPNAVFLPLLSEGALYQRLLAYDTTTQYWPDWCAFLHEAQMLNTRERTVRSIFTISTRYFAEFLAMRNMPKLQRIRLLTAKINAHDGQTPKRKMTLLQKQYLVASYLASRLLPNALFTIFGTGKMRKTAKATYENVPRFADPNLIFNVGRALGFWTSSLGMQSIMCIVFLLTAFEQRVTTNSLNSNSRDPNSPPASRRKMMITI